MPFYADKPVGGGRSQLDMQRAQRPAWQSKEEDENRKKLIGNLMIGSVVTREYASQLVLWGTAELYRKGCMEEQRHVG